jgi:hypothetical protein
VFHFLLVSNTEYSHVVQGSTLLTDEHGCNCLQGSPSLNYFKLPTSRISLSTKNPNFFTHRATIEEHNQLSK